MVRCLKEFVKHCQLENCRNEIKLCKSEIKKIKESIDYSEQSILNEKKLLSKSLMCNDIINLILEKKKKSNFHKFQIQLLQSKLLYQTVFDDMPHNLNILYFDINEQKLNCLKNITLEFKHYIPYLFDNEMLQKNTLVYINGYDIINNKLVTIHSSNISYNIIFKFEDMNFIKNLLNNEEFVEHFNIEFIKQFQLYFDGLMEIFNLENTFQKEKDRILNNMCCYTIK